MEWYVIAIGLVLAAMIAGLVVILVFYKRKKSGTPGKPRVKFQVSNDRYRADGSSTNGVSYSFIWFPPTTGYGPGYKFFYSFELKDPTGKTIANSSNTGDTSVTIPTPYTSGIYTISVYGNNQFGQGPASKASGTISIPSVKSLTATWANHQSGPYADVVLVLQGAPAQSVTLSAGEVQGQYINDYDNQPIENLPMVSSDGLTWKLSVQPAINPPNTSGGYSRGFQFNWYATYSGFWGGNTYSAAATIPGSSPTDVGARFVDQRTGSRLWGKTIGPSSGTTETSDQACMENCLGAQGAKGYSYWSGTKSCWCVGQPFMSPKWTVEQGWDSGEF